MIIIYFFILLFFIIYGILSTKSIVFVISRYNENLEWLKEAPFNKYDVILYNKGINDDYYDSPKIIKKIKLENVGKCDHTYLYHIIHNYDNLADINVFLPGSINMDYKMKRATKLMYEIEKNNSSVFLYNSKNKNIKKSLYDFQLDEWKTSNGANKSLNNETTLKLSEIRPFGKWYENKFDNVVIKHATFHGILSVSKEDILKRPKEYYENLIKELSDSSNPEAGHYFERSWEAVFYPMNTKFIEGFT